MKRKQHILAACLILALLFSGCMNQARRLVPQQPQQPQQGQQGAPQGQNMQQVQPNGGDLSPYISATYEKADVDYLTAASKTPARSGPSTNYPVVYTINAGTRVRVLAKYDGWYVAYHNNRLGFIPATTTRLSTPGTTSPPVPDVPGTTGSNPTSEESRMLSLINSERAKVGAKPLSANTELTKVARLKSKDIADNNYFSHTSPTYGSPFEMLKKYGISYLYAGENLAKNQTVDAAHQALMNSAGHKKNILNPDFNQIGIGVVTDEGNMKVYTQMFIGK